jgi:alpha-tubulin suppressor-like RCC1 family protein
VNIKARLYYEGTWLSEPAVTFTPGTSVAFDVPAAIGTETGTWMVKVDAIDRAGNSTRDSAFIFADHSAPVVRVIAPYITEQESAAIVVYGNDVGGDTVSFAYSVNSGKEQAAGVMIGVPSSFPLFPTRWVFGSTISVPVSHGVNTVTITARDLSGNQSIQTVRLIRGQAPVALASAADHSCMLMPDGSVRCFGRNNVGQLGDGTTTDRTGAVPVLGAPPFTQIVAGVQQSCGVTAASELYCWGRTPPGRDSVPLITLVPRRVAVIPPIRSVAAGDGYLCAIMKTDASLDCWGAGSLGQLGDGAAEDRPTPQLTARNDQYQSVVASAYSVCALSKSGHAYCWGRNSSNERGDEAHMLGEQPDLVQGTPFPAAQSSTFAKLFIGDSEVCGLDVDGVGKCWGKGWAPRPLELSYPIIALSVPFETACAIIASGKIYCWGANIEEAPDGGQSIPSPFTDPFAGFGQPPVHTLVGITGVSITGSFFYTCVIATTGSLYCFGSYGPTA